MTKRISTWTNDRGDQTITIKKAAGPAHYSVILTGSCNTSYRVMTLARACEIYQGMKDAAMQDDLLKDRMAAVLASVS